MADPTVLKVLHGGANDIAWLQRDAHVYLVNVFDTEKAAQVRDWRGRDRIDSCVQPSGHVCTHTRVSVPFV
jgi:ribonuclease D